MKVFTVILALAGLGAILPKTDSEKVSPRDKELNAADICHAYVKERLKAPSTAKFPNSEDSNAVQITGTGDGPYTVAAFVDSQNSFGAMMRDQYTCIVRYIGNHNWQLVDLSIGDDPPATIESTSPADASSNTTDSTAG